MNTSIAAHNCKKRSSSHPAICTSSYPLIRLIFHPTLLYSPLHSVWCSSCYKQLYWRSHKPLDCVCFCTPSVHRLSQALTDFQTDPTSDTTTTTGTKTALKALFAGDFSLHCSCSTFYGTLQVLSGTTQCTLSLRSTSISVDIWRTRTSGSKANAATGDDFAAWMLRIDQ